ncbi:hypothetical protein COY28_07205, partial [Candidatus Woesearchaeota archaeon CG_4_10_14_0_2_um_filter_57_5]
MRRQTRIRTSSRQQVSLLILALIICMLPAAIALEEFTTKEFFDSESIVVNDQSFQVFVQTERVRVENQGRSWYVNNNTCNLINSTKWCLNRISFDESAIAEKASVTIYSLLPVINAKLSSPSPIILGEPAVITLEVNNSGGMATPLRFVQQLPDDIILLETDGCMREGNSILLSTVLNPDQSVSCSVRLTTTTPQDRSIGGTITYNAPLETTMNLDPVWLDASPQVTVSLFTDTQSLLLGSKTNLTINISNRNASSIDEVIMRVELPGTVDWSVRKGTLVRQDPMLNATFSLGKNKTQSFTLILQATRLGQGTARISTWYRKAGTWYTGEPATMTYATTAKDLEVMTNFDTEVIETGELKTLYVYIRNPNTQAALKNIYILQNSPLFGNKTRRVDELNASQQEVIEIARIQGPENVKDMVYQNEYTIFYETAYGDRLNVTATKSLQLKEAPGLTIQASASPDRITAGEEATVRVDITNPRDVDLDGIMVTDELELSTRGIRQNRMSLSSGASATAYIYTVPAPDVTHATTYYANTTVMYNYSGKEYRFGTLTPITITPKRILVAAQKSMSSYSTPSGGTASVDYRLTNNDKDAAYQIRIPLVPIAGLEVAQRNDTLVAVIMPKESISIQDVDMIRGTAPGSYAIPETVITFTDVHGNVFNATTNTLSVNVVKGFSNEPILHLVKQASQD